MRVGCLRVGRRITRGVPALCVRGGLVARAVEYRGLDEQLIREVADGVEVGNYPEVVAGSLGVHKGTFSRWWSLGQEVSARPSFPEGCSPHEVLCATLADQLEVSGNIAEKWLLGKAQEDASNGKSTWTAWMTILERTRPGWQRREKFEAPGRSVEDELAEIEARKRQRDAET
jgi:hypothetical protein